MNNNNFVKIINATNSECISLPNCDCNPKIYKEFEITCSECIALIRMLKRMALKNRICSNQINQIIKQNQEKYGHNCTDSGKWKEIESQKWEIKSIK